MVLEQVVLVEYTQGQEVKNHFAKEWFRSCNQTLFVCLKEIIYSPVCHSKVWNTNVSPKNKIKKQLVLLLRTDQTFVVC